MGDRDTRTTKVDTTIFWHIILPVLVLVLVLFVLFVIYSMPDWALNCSSDLLPVRRLANSLK